MRRINPYVKEAINAARYDSVRNEEILGAYFESTNHDDKTLNQIHVLIDECRENDKQQLLILLQLEANEVTTHFGVLDKSADAGSAFPWESVDAIPQSLNEYIGETVCDIFDAIDIPSSQIADEFEVWLDRLWQYYESNA